MKVSSTFFLVKRKTAMKTSASHKPTIPPPLLLLHATARARACAGKRGRWQESAANRARCGQSRHASGRFQAAQHVARAADAHRTPALSGDRRTHAPELDEPDAQRRVYRRGDDVVRL